MAVFYDWVNPICYVNISVISSLPHLPIKDNCNGKKEMCIGKLCIKNRLKVIMFYTDIFLIFVCFVLFLFKI